MHTSHFSRPAHRLAPILLSLFLLSACQFLPSQATPATPALPSLPADSPESNWPMSPRLPGNASSLTANANVLEPVVPGLKKPLPSLLAQDLPKIEDEAPKILLQNFLAQDPVLRPLKAGQNPATQFSNELTTLVNAYTSDKDAEAKLLTGQKTFLQSVLTEMSTRQTAGLFGSSQISEAYTPVLTQASVQTLQELKSLPFRALNIENQAGLVLTHLGIKRTLPRLDLNPGQRARFVFEDILLPRAEKLNQAWSGNSFQYLGVAISYLVEAPLYTRPVNAAVQIATNPDLDKYQTETALLVFGRQDLSDLVSRKLSYEAFATRLIIYSNTYHNQTLRVAME